MARWLPVWLHAAGFLAVNDFLQCEGGEGNVFAAGDIAAFTKSPRPKAGVFAVRAVGSTQCDIVILQLKHGILLAFFVLDSWCL
jgi:NADH dehydrogenase FAD-containing subunit